MNNSWRTAALCCVVILIASPSQAQETVIKKQDVPKNIRDAFQKDYPQVKTIGYSKEIVDGTVFYEIESTEADIHRDVTYAADGSLVSVEETLPFEEMPEAVRATISSEYPKATIGRCEKVTKSSTTEYEILVSLGKIKHELVLDETGTIVKKEVKKNLR